MLFPDIPFIIVSLLFFAGRYIDLSRVADLSQGFIEGGAVVSKPLMAALVFVVAVCCTVFVYPRLIKTEKTKRRKPGVFGALCGAFFIAAAVFSMINTFKWGGFLGFDIAEILGGISLIILSFTDIRGRKYEAVPFIFTMAAFAAVCLNYVIIDISTIHDTVYVFGNAAFIICFAFMLLIFRNVYSPSSSAKVMLYFASLLNFIFSGMCMLALAFVYIRSGNFEARYIFLYAAYIAMGFYSAAVAFSMTSEKQAKGTKTEKSEIKRAETEADGDETETSAAEEVTVAADTEETKQDDIISLFAHNLRDENTENAPAEKETKSAAQRDITPAKTAETAKKSDGRTVFKSDGKSAKSQGKKVVYKADK